MRLTQFRIHYPQGSLISELVTIDHGQYVVRVLVQVNQITLATGLAADSTIEVAEDRARERALSSLNLENQSLETTKTVKTTPQQPSQGTKNTVESPQVPVSSPEKEIDAPTNSKTVETVKQSVKPPVQPSLATEKSRTKPSKEKASSTTKPTQPLEESLPISETLPEPDIQEPSLPLTESESWEKAEMEEETLPFAEASPEPEIETKPPIIEEQSLDFSEIIARSNAELKRLGWTTEQGREYLIQTYGKRSRQVLSDEQLLEFLHYLESLPTPS